MSIKTSIKLKSGKTAIIIGASGLTGSRVLSQLLEDPRYDHIKTFSRKSGNVTHTKLQEFVVDLTMPETFKEKFTGDEVYCCIGTTRKKTPDTETYRSIDIGIPLMAARLGKENGIKKMAVISAIGANKKSRFIYNRIKGEMEEAVLKEGPECVYILRPSFIGGKRMEKRAGESVGLALFRIFKPLFIGPMKKYAVVEADQIARRMIEEVNSDRPSAIIESDQI